MISTFAKNGRACVPDEMVTLRSEIFFLTLYHQLLLARRRIPFVPPPYTHSLLRNVLQRRCRCSRRSSLRRPV